LSYRGMRLYCIAVLKPRQPAPVTVSK